MIDTGTRRRGQPAPPNIIHEALTEPNRDPARQWLVLLDDETHPTITDVSPSEVVWTSLWPTRTDALIRFEIAADGRGGTDLRWTLELDEPSPDQSKLGHLRQRINQLINANMRYSFGQ